MDSFYSKIAAEAEDDWDTPAVGQIYSESKVSAL